MVQGSYPPGAELGKEFLIDVLGSIIQEEEERLEGFYPVTLEGRDVISYYSGEELNQVFGIILGRGESEREYRGGLVQATARILKRGGSISTTDEWGNLWNWVKTYPKMSREYRITDAFRDPSMDTILSISAENGLLTMDELVDRAGLRTDLSRDVITTYVHILEALGLLETHWDEAALEERVYMVRDLLYYRKKPEQYKEIAEFIPGYEERFNSFIEKYKRDMRWKDDKEVLPGLLTRPGIYDVLERFEREGVISRSEVTEDFASKARQLVEWQLAGETDDYFYYLAAPSLELIFPKYTISRVLARARDEEITKNEVIEYLNTLKESYL
ncbi:MAG: hypothetical protein GWN64_03515 [Candidatus Thorarchaeota archaeon]|nr:hypothetical protein [Candidatus Thorarchaeota archaeon]